MQEIEIWSYEQEVDAQSSLDFEIQVDCAISAGQTDQVIINDKKENLLNSELFRPGRWQSKIERKRKEG